MVKRGVVDLATAADWTPATGDMKLTKDQGSLTNVTNLPTSGGGSVLWSFTASATELQCAELAVQIVDSATKAVEDNMLRIYTYGNAAAKFPVDFSDLVRLGLTALPNAAAAAAGGLPTGDATNSVKIRSGLKKGVALPFFRFSMTLTGTTTPATGKAGTMTVRRGLDAGALAVGTLGAVTEIGGGDYVCSFAAADTNGDAISFEAAEATCNTTKVHMIADA